MMEIENSDTDIPNTPPEIRDAAEAVTLGLLPEKSKKVYEKQYNLFVTWCKSKKICKYSENVLLTYFSEKAKVLKSSSLWSMYSMLKSTLSTKNDINLQKFKKLTALLKKQGVGYKPKKSKTFTQEEIYRFLREADDNIYLLKKVVLIIGIAGACRRDELVKMNIKDVEDKESILIVTIPDSKTKISRTFTVTNNNQENSIEFLSFYRKYVALRPKNKNTPARLFLKFNKGKCFNQVVGMNTIAKIPNDIANYLKLPDCHLYTGHCFRRTSATLLVHGGGDIMQLKRHGGWKSSTVAEGYIDSNINEKIETSKKILTEPSNNVQVIECSNRRDENFTISEYSPNMSSGSGIVIKDCSFNIQITNANK